MRTSQRRSSNLVGDISTPLASETSLVVDINLIKPYYGGVAQLGEHLPCKQGVRGSNPLISIARELNESESKTKLEFSRRHVNALSERKRA